MSCGHCQIKVNAELNSNGFHVLNIDMINNTVIVDALEKDYHKIVKVLDKINYLVEDTIHPDVLKEYKFWNDLLNDDKQYNNMLDYMSKQGIEVTGFDEDTCELIITCTQKEYESILQLEVFQ